VINKGVGGEMAFQMLARLERDVLPYHPQLSYGRPAAIMC
jgi:hypothetical protein